LPASTITRNALVRCTYCAADKLVDTSTMARAAVSQARVDSMYADAVQNEAVQVGVGLVAAGVGLLVLPLFCMWAGCMGYNAIHRVEEKVEIPPKDDESYIVVDTPEGACAAEIRGVDGDGSGIVVFDLPLPRGTEFMNPGQPGLAAYPDVRAKAFVGRKGFIRTREGTAARGVVSRVVATRADPYTPLVVLETPDGSEVTGPLLLLCIEDAKGLPVYRLTPQPAKPTQ
jgi:hypothetical protein